MFLQVPKTCWRCNVDIGTYVHIRWSCPTIQPLWDKVVTIYEAVQSTTVPKTPEIALLSIIPGSKKTNRMDILFHCITATRNVTVHHWRLDHTPPLQEWVALRNDLMYMEKLTVSKTNSLPQFHKIWHGWEYRQLNVLTEKLRAPASS